MTIFIVASHVIAFLAIIVGWLKGGHSERFGAAVMLVSYGLSSIIYRWRIGDFYWAEALKTVALLMIFVWLAFRTDRWWPLVVTAALVLVVLVQGMTLMVSDLSTYAAMSAEVGLWILIDSALLVGAGERWLAGEPAAGGAVVWRRGRRAS